MSLHSLMFAFVLVGAACKIAWTVYKLASGGRKALSFVAETSKRSRTQADAMPITPAQTADAFGLSLAADRIASDEPEWQQYYGNSADWA